LRAGAEVRQAVPDREIVLDVTPRNLERVSR
jgi:hypothetical protein